MTPENIKLLIREGEGLSVEFKEKYSSRSDEDIIAFANTKGGTLLLGVRDEEWFSRGVALAPECNRSIVDASIQWLQHLRETGTFHQLIAVACSVDHARQALADYTESGGKGKTAINQEEAVSAMLSKYEVCCALFHGFDWAVWTTESPAERLGLLPTAQEHILKQEDGKTRLLKSVTDLSQAFALAVPHEKASAIRDDVSFFQAVRAALAKAGLPGPKAGEDLDHAIRQLVSKAIASDQVIDIFAAAGLRKPDISILSDEFLEEVRGMPHKNLAVELLKKLLNDEIKTRLRKNIVAGRSFAEMLERSIRAYQNRALETAQVIEELIVLAKDMREANSRGEKLKLTEEEVAFYDALETNDSAVKVLGDEALKTIARELVSTVHNNLTIDWTLRENVRAKLRVMVKRVLRKYGYPPDKQEKATQTVLEQAELLCEG